MYNLLSFPRCHQPSTTIFCCRRIWSICFGFTVPNMVILFKQSAYDSLLRENWSALDFHNPCCNLPKNIRCQCIVSNIVYSKAITNVGFTKWRFGWKRSLHSMTKSKWFLLTRYSFALLKRTHLQNYKHLSLFSCCPYLKEANTHIYTYIFKHSIHIRTVSFHIEWFIH